MLDTAGLKRCRDCGRWMPPSPCFFGMHMNGRMMASCLQCGPSKGVIILAESLGLTRKWPCQKRELKSYWNQPSLAWSSSPLSRRLFSGFNGAAPPLSLTPWDFPLQRRHPGDPVARTATGLRLTFGRGSAQKG